MKAYGSKINHPYRLEWMSDDDWAEVEWYYGCVCDYDMEWANKQDYEAWCKRVLKNK
jgi:hypothetical protein